MGFRQSRFGRSGKGMGRLGQAMSVPIAGLARALRLSASISILLVGGRAAAAEHVVMPYVCTPLGGAVELDPSGPMRYPIISPHDTMDHRHCSPANAGRCKTWRLHRFDIDCNGVRVPWAQIVAAASELNDGPAFLNGGRLNIRMRPPRVRPSYRDGAWRDGGPGGWQMGPDGFGRFERTPYGRGDIAVLPQGFAPVIAMEARFEAAPSGGMNSGGRLEGGLDEQPGDPMREKIDLQHRKEASPQAAPQPVPAQKSATGNATKTNTAAAEKSSSGANVARQEQKPDAVKLGASVSGGAERDKSGAAGSDGSLTILNRDGKAAADDKNVLTAADQSASAQAQQKSAIRSEDKKSEDKSVTLPPPGSPGSKLAAASEETDKGGGEGIDIALDRQSGTAVAGFLKSTSGQALLSLMAIAFLTAGFLMMMRRQDRAPAAAGAGRDFGSVSLGGLEANAGTADIASAKAIVSFAAAPARNAPIAPQEVPPAAPAPGTLSAALETRAATDWMPATRDDALHVLGASPDASIEAIRKIVDGLRQSWHPDLARSEDDRLVRERRMKLINVAWDVVQSTAAA